MFFVTTFNFVLSHNFVRLCKFKTIRFLVQTNNFEQEFKIKVVNLVENKVKKINYVFVSIINFFLFTFFFRVN